MTNRDTIADKIRAYLEEQFPLARQQTLADDDSLLESGVIDSMGILEVVAFLEKEFGLVLADDDLVPDHFASIRALTDFVNQRVAAVTQEG